MKPTYDFSTPRKPAPTAEPTHPPVRPKRLKALVIGLVAVAVLAIAGILIFRSTKDDVSSANPRFCAISSQLSGALTAAGVPPIGIVPDTVRPEAVAKALQQVGAGVGELEKVAPTKVRSDVVRVVAALRAGASGDMGAVRDPAFANAEKRIAMFRATRAGCPAVETGLGSNDG